MSSACIPASYYLSYWNVSLFTFACIDPAVDNKQIHNTVIRTMPSHSKIGSAMVKLFQHYGWTRAIIMVMDGLGSNPCVYGYYGMQNSFRCVYHNHRTMPNILLARYIYFTDRSPHCQSTQIMELSSTSNLVSKYVILSDVHIVYYRDHNITIAETMKLPVAGPMSTREIDEYLRRAQDRGRSKFM